MSLTDSGFYKEELKEKSKNEEKVRMRKEALTHSISRNKHQNNIDEGEYSIPNVIAEAEKYYEWLIEKL